MSDKQYQLLIDLNERDFLINENIYNSRLKASKLNEYVNKARKNWGNNSKIPDELKLNYSMTAMFHCQNKLVKLYHHKNNLISKNKYNWITVLRESKMNKI